MHQNQSKLPSSSAQPSPVFAVLAFDFIEHTTQLTSVRTKKKDKKKKKDRRIRPKSGFVADKLYYSHKPPTEGRVVGPRGAHHLKTRLRPQKLDEISELAESQVD